MNLWWAIPNVLAGMSMPYVHLERRMGHGASLRDFDDDLPPLWDAGVRGVVCLLNIVTDEAVFNSAGFNFLCLPVPDGAAPTVEQLQKFVSFVDQSRTREEPTAVHCEAGCGRTGTMLAGYLIAHGNAPSEAIKAVRRIEPIAVETMTQIRFLESVADLLRRDQ